MARVGGAAGTPRRICVVSESRPIRWLLATLLEVQGYIASEADSQEPSLDGVVAFRPDALVVEAAGEGARNLVAQLRRRPALARCGLLVISARFETPVHSQGAWASFTRSFDLLKLQAAVAACAAANRGG